MQACLPARHRVYSPAAVDPEDDSHRLQRGIECHDVRSVHGWLGAPYGRTITAMARRRGNMRTMRVMVIMAAMGLATAAVPSSKPTSIQTSRPAKVDDAMAKPLLTAYRASPAPLPRPGMSQDDQQKLDRMVQGAAMSDEPAIVEKYEDWVNSARRENQPILAYRDELYRRLP